MPDIYLDVSRIIWRNSTGRMPTGIDRICHAYLEHYRPRARAVVQHKGVRHSLPEALSQELFTVLLDRGEDVKRKVVQIVGRSLLQKRPGNAEHPGIYLNVGHTGLEQRGLAAWTRKVNLRPVMLVADLIPISHPEFCRPGEKEKHESRMRNLLQAGEGVIGISHDTIAELQGFADRIGVPMPPAFAAHIGIGGLSAAAPDSVDALANRPYFVVLGTIEGRKNHMLILNIWRELVTRYGDKAPQLVIIGQRGWECEQVVDMLERCETLRGHVAELPRLSDVEVSRYLCHARALLFPSFVEGYGMPLVEALALGTPVLASDLAVFRELAGGIPEYFNPIDGMSWMSAIMDYAASDGVRRKAQQQRMANYHAPSWDDHFSMVDDWLARNFDGTTGGAA